MKDVRFSQMSPEDSKMYTDKLLGILKKIMKICEENNLNWFCAYGSCLGAIRDKGRIPWDDDIDICIPRPDYDKFLKICESADLGDYELITAYNTPEFLGHHARMYDKNSTILFDKSRKEVGGVLVDIFPLDGAGDGKIHFNYVLFRFWQFVIFHNYYLRLTRSDRWVLLKKGQVFKYLGALVRAFLGLSPLRKICLKMLEHAKKWYSYETSDYVVWYNTVYKMRDVVKKEWVENTILVPYENVMVPVPEHYDEYLTKLYGDYMTPPPLDKRDNSWHVFSFLDMEKRLTLDEILIELSKE